MALANSEANSDTPYQRLLEERDQLLKKEVGLKEQLAASKQQLNDLYAAHSRTADSLFKRERQLDAYREIGQAVLATLDLDQLLNTLAHQVINAGIFRSLMIALVDEKAQQVEVVSNYVCKVIDDRPVPNSPVGPVSEGIGMRYRLDEDNITAQVARTGQMEIIEEWDDRFDPKVNSKIGRARREQASYFIPVKSGERVLAVLATGSELCDKEEILQRIEAMQPLFDQVAIALDHAMLYAEAKEQGRLLAGFQQIGQAILASINMDQILDTLARQVINTGIFRSLMIALVDEQAHKVEVALNYVCLGDDIELGKGQQSPSSAPVSMPFVRQMEDGQVNILDERAIVGTCYDLDEANITAQVARNGKMEVIEEWDERFDENAGGMETRQGKVAYFIPVKSGERVLAVLATGSDLDHKEQMLQRIEVMKPLFDQVAIALDHAMIYAEAKEQTRQLDQLGKLRALGEMAAGVSHNLNNLLAGVLIPAQILHSEEEDSRKKQDLADVVKSAQNAAKLVRQLYGAVRIKEEEPLEATDINQVIGEVIQANRHQWKDQPERRGFSVEVVTDLGAVGLVQGQAARLHDVLLNLLLNAVDALPTGGQIFISTKSIDSGVELIFRDTGIGMEEETRQRVFEPFFSTKPVVGTGLGLSTVYTTVSGWGGKITVDSQLGRGTSFTLWLPIWAGELEIADKQVALEEVPGRVLVVDDDPMVGKVLDRLLGGRHYVEVVAGGNEALNVVERESFEVALIDLGMPGMRGDQVAEALKARLPQLSLILITGWNIESPDSIFDFLLHKPFDDAEKVRRVVTKAIQLNRQGQRRQ